LALTAAALAASIEGLRAWTVSETQGGAVAGLLHDWLGGRAVQDGALAARAAALAIELAPPFAVLVLEADPLPGEGTLRRIARLLIDTASAASDASTTTAVAAGVPGPLSAAMAERRMAIVVQGVDPATMETAARDVHAVLVAQYGAGPIYAGIGRIAPTTGEAPRAYAQALQALTVARRLGSRQRVSYFGALGAYRVLAATAPEELASFHEDTLGRLRMLDEKSGSELLRTLETYLLCGGSPQETAQRLHAHRNTVLYRLDRIAEALAVDVRDPETQLTLFLALRAADMLGVSLPRRNLEAAVSPPRRSLVTTNRARRK
jgi:purine catabolism regulator